ncbi:MAG: PAS domain S-box protein [Deltaproteobacteria bacterium]|nr:PAS domain S-box protein [Candidatus Zymogenaceae bacterium]
MDEISQLVKENETLKKTIASLTDKIEIYASLDSAAAIAQALDLSLGGIAITDSRWRVRYVNPAIVRLWGYESIDEVIETPTRVYFADLGPEESAEITNEILTQGTWQGELNGKRKDGSVFPVLMAGSRLVNDAGVFNGVVVSCIDMTDYRLAMSALSESEDRYRTTLDHLGDSVYLVDRDLVLLYVNERINRHAKALGVDFRGGIGKKVTELNIELGYDVQAEFSRVIETGNPLVTEGEIVIGGRVFSMQKRRIPIVKNGVVTHIVTVLHNITDQKASEEKLRQSEQKYRVIADSVPVGIFIHVGGVLRYVGKEAARMLGYMTDELVGTNIGDLIYRDDREMVIDRARRRALGEDVAGGYEIRAVKKGGDILPILVYGSNIEYLGEKAIQGVFIDISERKLAERELKDTLQRLTQSEDRYRLLVESSHDGIVVITDAKITFFNRRVVEMLDYEETELIDRSFADVIHPEDRQLVMDNYLKRIRGEDSPSRYEFRVITKSGDIIFAEINVVLTRWEGKRASLCFIRDISERKTAENERAQLFDQLLSAQKMEAIGTLAGGIAHNFNNILVGIMGYSEYLLTKKDENDPDYKAIRTIHEGSIKASELTRQLLNIARGGEFKRVRLSLNDVIARVLPLISGTFNKSIEIQTVLDPNPMIIEGDVGQIEQCLLNICINARDAMPEGGRLVIETYTRRLEEDFVKLHLGATVGNYIVLSVTDTGVGMPPHIKDHIFEPFFTTKKHAGGTGMGLATVWGIVKNHRGIVSVYTEPGSGTAFRLYFPAIVQVIQEADVEREEIFPGKGETLLLVDDEPIIRDMWGEILEEIGYRVLYAANGDEALSVLEGRGGKVDLVILDLVMPHMGGKEAFAGIRQRFPGVKVLVSSGYSENGEAREMLDNGADGFIQKPYQIRMITVKIREILEGG